MRPLPSLAAAILAAPLFAPLNAQSESADPPPGAPWTKSFVEAHRRALESGLPIFVYSTKTY